MRRIEAITREIDEQNRRTFSDEDRANAQTAWDIYMFEIIGSGFRCEFDFYPGNVNLVPSCSRLHHSDVGQLKARVKRFNEFIELIERLGDRSAVQLNPMWHSRDDAAETITRTLEPQAVAIYRAFGAALVSYLDELSKENPDWSHVDNLARQVAYTVNVDDWRRAGVATPERGVSSFGTRWFLEAILAEPKNSVD